jgi:hypothetical protein
MTRSNIRRCYDVRGVWDGDCGSQKEGGRVYRKRYKSLVKDHKGMNNTKYQHHMMMYATGDPRGDHSYYIYGHDLSLWLA